MAIYLCHLDKDAPLVDILGGRLQIFQQSAPSIERFLTSSFTKSKIVLVPHDCAFWSREYLHCLIGLSDKRPILFFNRSDRPLRFNSSNFYSLQNHFSLDQKCHQIVLPYNITPIKNSPYRVRNSTPTVSFTGFVPRVLSRGLLRDFKLSHPSSLLSNPSVIRRFGIRAIRKSGLSHHVIIRNHYGGARSLIDNPKDFRAVYESTLINSDLVFCPRGEGNSSQRFYEALSAGRVPLVPDSGIIFPRVRDFNIKEYLVSTSITSKNLYEEVNNFWESINPKNYVLLQKDIRHIYRSHLSYGNFINRLFKSIHTNGAIDSFFIHGKFNH